MIGKDLVSKALTPLNRYGHILNTHDLVKIAAVLLMLVDHIGLYFLENEKWCRLIGRAAAPLFFLLVGYSAKLRLRPSLFIYGLLLTLSGSWIHQQIWINILVNFIAIHVLLTLLPPSQLNLWQRTLFFILCIIFNFFTYRWIEYGTLGLMLAFSARLVALGDRQALFWLALSLLCYATWEGNSFQFLQTQNQLIALTFLMMGVLMIMLCYQLRPLPAYPRPMLTPSLFISRYSLEIYFYHLIFFQIYAILQAH